MSRPASIATRLTLLFALVSSVVLLALGGLVVSALERHFRQQDIDLLEGKILLIRALVGQAGSDAALPALAGPLHDAFVGHHDLTVRVARADGHLIFANAPLTVPEAASATSAAAKAARRSGPSTMIGRVAQPAAIPRTRVDTPRTVGITTASPGTARATRSSAAPKRGPRRSTSPRRDPGRQRTRGASGAMPCAARKVAASWAVASGTVVTGWPTKSQVIPAASM